MPAFLKDIKKDTLPDLISLDTSFLLRCAAKFEPQISSRTPDPDKYCNCIKNFIAKKVVCCVSDFVIEEIYYKFLQYHGSIAYDACCSDKKRYRNWKVFCEAEPKRLVAAYSLIDKFNEFLKENLIFSVPYEKDLEIYLTKAATDLIKTFGIVSRDAFIIAHSIHSKINDFLAVDRKWKEVDNIVYWTM